MAPLKVLILSDGKPGHYHLSEGIVAAARRLRPLDVRRLELRRPYVLSTRVLSALVNLGMPPERVLTLVYGIDPKMLEPASLVVSAGGKTLAANIAAAQLLGAKNVFYGSLRRFKPDDFSLVLTSYRAVATRPRHAMTLKPSGVDPDDLPRPQTGDAQTMGVLIGGPTRGIGFSANDWRQLYSFLASMHAERRARAIVSNSRRTPPSVSDEIAQRAKDPASGIARFIDVRTAGSGTLEQLFAESDTVLCTADSSSMLSEAIWLRRRTIALMPERAWLTLDERDYRGYLEQNGWAQTLPMGEITSRSFDQAVGALRPLDRNPLELLAALLQENLPELFAGR